MKPINRGFLAIVFIMMALVGFSVGLPTHGLLELGNSIYGFANELNSGTDSGISSVVTASRQLIRRGIVSPSNKELKVNSIGFGVPAVACFALRLINRRFFVGSKLQWEDYVMTVTVFLYVSLLILINVSARFATNLYPKEDSVTILAEPQDVASRIIGSKIVIALEQCMLFATWGVKFCVWGFQRRICRQLPKYERVLSWLLAYIVLGLFLIEVAYLGLFCRPFSQYWAVPVTNDQCATYANYSIMQAVFNMTSDTAFIIIPIHMVFQNRHMPHYKKIVLALVFSLGIFTIVAAILNKYFNFNSPFTTEYQLWYIRESSVAVIVSNIICTWQFFQRIFNAASWGPRSTGNHHESNDAVLGPNGTVPRTIGGTPRVPQNTPDGGFRARFQPRRDLNASLFSSVFGTHNQSAEHVNTGIDVDHHHGNNEKSRSGIGAPRLAHKSSSYKLGSLASILEEVINPEEEIENLRLATATPPIQTAHRLRTPSEEEIISATRGRDENFIVSHMLKNTANSLSRTPEHVTPEQITTEKAGDDSSLAVEYREREGIN